MSGIIPHDHNPSFTGKGFQEHLDDAAGVRKAFPIAGVRGRVEEILADVKQRGDKAVIEATNRFDRLSVESTWRATLSHELTEKGLRWSVG